MYDLKIYKRVVCCDNEVSWKVWKGIDLSLQNWQPQFDEFWPEHSNVSKVCTLMGSFSLCM